MMFFLEDEGGTGREAFYANFHVRNWLTSYRLEVSGFDDANIFDTKDDFSDLSGGIFATKDNETDAFFSHIASSKKPGW